jgi:hypothetical protein
MMGMMRDQVAELAQERRMLLDRLATLGLGGPLFSSAPALPAAAEDEEPVDAEAKELERLMNLRRRPSKLADALTRKAYRDYNKMQAGPSVKWMPKVDGIHAALDEAEASGKTQA